MDSVAIVTGASRGIGRSAAIRLARDFSAVVLAARNTLALKEVATAVKSAGAESLALDLDLSLGGTQRLQGLGRIHVGQCGPRPEAGIRSRRSDQCSHYCACESIRRVRY